MTKSNQRAVRMRKTNRQLVIADRKEREARREFHRPPMRQSKKDQLMLTTMLMALYSRSVGLFRSIAVFLNPFAKTKRTQFSLDLTKRNVFDGRSKRNAGPAVLRSWWPVLHEFKMRSTRDGKQV